VNLALSLSRAQRGEGLCRLAEGGELIRGLRSSGGKRSAASSIGRWLGFAARKRTLAGAKCASRPLREHAFVLEFVGARSALRAARVEEARDDPLTGQIVERAEKPLAVIDGDAGSALVGGT